MNISKESHRLFDESDDLPFGEAGERRRLAMEREVKDHPSIVAKIRDEIKRFEERARQRREK